MPSGTAVLTVVATDPGGLASEPVSFEVNIAAVNDAPTTHSVSRFTVSEDSPARTFDIASAFSDVDNPNSELTLAVTGNTNPGLFSAVRLADGQLILEFTPDAFGTATLTIRATDSGSLFAETTLIVDVVAMNDAPVIGRLLDAPDPAIAGAGLRLQAINVTDDGTIHDVQYYRDADGSAQHSTRR